MIRVPAEAWTRTEDAVPLDGTVCLVRWFDLTGSPVLGLLRKVGPMQKVCYGLENEEGDWLLYDGDPDRWVLSASPPHEWVALDGV